MTLRGTLFLCACLGANAAAALAEAPAAWRTLEKICRESPYDKPMDAVVVANVAGWQELDRAQLDVAADLYGSLWTLEHPMLDIKTATSEEISATFRQMRTQFLASLLFSKDENRFGVLYLAAPEFTAFVAYRRSKSIPRLGVFPCQIYVIGSAAFLDERFSAEEWQSYSTSAEETAGQFTESYLAAVSRNFTYNQNVQGAGLTVPDYSVIINGF
ncbi:MAG: hypothetical protein AB7S99_00490 [Pseudodonghicola sp.]